MKKIILFVLSAIVLIGCSKDDNESQEPQPTSQTVKVNVFYTYTSEYKESVASPTIVRLYEQSVADNFDYDKSVSSMHNSGHMTLKDGTIAIPAYTSGSFDGINTINNVKNEDYTVIVYYKPDGFTFSSFCYFGYKPITVSNTIDQSYKIVFVWGTPINGGESGGFVKK